MIIFDKVTKKYQKSTALQDVSFRIENKEFTFMIGPSGAGKTTIFKLLIAQELPTAGTITYNGIGYARLTEPQKMKIRREIGVVFQDYKLLPRRTLWENVAFIMEVLGKSDKEIKKDVENILTIVGLKGRENHFPEELSGGESQRAAIARVLAQTPDVILADEPTANLDDEIQKGIMETLHNIYALGKTVVVATHNERFAKQYGTHALLVKGGKLTDDYVLEKNSAK